MSAVLQWSDRRTQLGILLLDVLMTEEIDFASQVTMYPVENGSTITDHVTQGVKTVRLGGLMSTANVSGAGSNVAGFGFGFDGSAKVIDVIESLETMHKTRALISVSTGQMVYQNMAFTSMNAQRSSDGKGGNWLSIKAELVEVRKVTLKTADVPAENVAAPAKGRAGATATAAGRTTPDNTNSLIGPPRNAGDSTIAKSLQNSARTPETFLNGLRSSLGAR